MPWGAVAAVAGAVITSSAAGDAADQQAASSAASLDEQRRQFDLTREDYAPYREAGKNALGQLVDEMGKPISSADVMSDPGYQFGLQQGQLGLDRKIAASGGRVSGAAIRAASRYNTNYASTGYGAAYQRGQDRLNRLAALAGIGQTATNSSAAAGSNAANAISKTIEGQGDAAAASNLYQGNIWGNATNQLASLYGRSGGTGNAQAAFSNTSLGSSGFGSGLAYGQRDLGENF